LLQAASKAISDSNGSRNLLSLDLCIFGNLFYVFGELSLQVQRIGDGVRSCDSRVSLARDLIQFCVRAVEANVHHGQQGNRSKQ